MELKPELENKLNIINNLKTSNILECSEEEININGLIIESEMTAKENFSLMGINLSYLNTGYDRYSWMPIEFGFSLVLAGVLHLLSFFLIPNIVPIKFSLTLVLLGVIFGFIRWYGGRNSIWKRLKVSPYDFSEKNIPKILSVFNLLLNNSFSELSKEDKEKKLKTISLGIKNKDKTRIDNASNSLVSALFHTVVASNKEKISVQRKMNAEAALKEMLESSQLTPDVKSELLVKALKRL